MNARNKSNYRKMTERYNPDRDLSADGNGNCLSVTWGEHCLLQMIAEQQNRIECLERQVARLLTAVPSVGESEAALPAGPPP